MGNFVAFTTVDDGCHDLTQVISLVGWQKLVEFFFLFKQKAGPEML